MFVVRDEMGTQIAAHEDHNNAISELICLTKNGATVSLKFVPDKKYRLVYVATAHHNAYEAGYKQEGQEVYSTYEAALNDMETERDYWLNRGRQLKGFEIWFVQLEEV